MQEWTLTEGSEGAAIVTLSTEPARGDAETTAIAATTGGLLLSRDGGRRWAPAPGLMGSVPLLAAALSPSYASDHLVVLGATDGIAYSYNLADWTLARLPRPAIRVTALALSPSFLEDGVVLAGTLEDGVLRSGNRGADFEAWNFGLLDPEVTAVACSPAFGQDGTALAATVTGVFRTTNGGRAWRETSLGDTATAILAAVFAPHCEGKVAFAADENGGVYRSDDTGRTWQTLTTPLDGLSLNALLLPLPPATDGNAPLTVAIAHETGVHLSPDGGATWQEWQAPGGVLSLAAQRQNDGRLVLLAGLLDGGIYRTELAAE